ncbi:MAG: SOUL family heme-binding protein [Coriobacteriia bacterium]
MSVESPAYEVVRREDPFELRRYGQYLTASVAVRADNYNNAAYEAFGVLADYIFGNNVAAGSIPMTAPVSTSRSTGERIAMTAPVVSERVRNEELDDATPLCTINCAGEYVVRFTMPSRYTELADLPQPNDPRVRLEVVPEHLAAVERFSGRMDDEMVVASVGRLHSWMAELALAPVGEPEAAQYDAPWKPGFIRHNEVIIPVAKA